MKFTAFFTVLLMFTATLAFSQGQPDYNSILKGAWVTAESLLTSEIESSVFSKYFKYEFDGEGGFYYASNEAERGEHGYYRINGNKVNMSGRPFTILSYGDDDLQIETNLTNQKGVYTSILVRKEKYDKLWNLRASNDQPLKSQPIFKGNFHLHDYIFSYYDTPFEFTTYTTPDTYKAPLVPPKEDVFLQIEVVIDSIGNAEVHGIKKSSGISDKRIERIIKRIENTSSYWIPASSDGRNLTKSITLTFVNHAKTSVQRQEDAVQYFRIAYQNFFTEDYNGAIRYSTDAISLDQTRFQFYVLRAVCYIKLGDVDKYCSDVLQANALNPFITLENVEVVNGKEQLINCNREKK